MVLVRLSRAVKCILGCSLVVGHGSNKKHTAKFKKNFFLLFWASFPLIIKKNQEISNTIYHQVKAQFVLKKKQV
ncbi:unnamed protein product [Staurois parvus]|uniref:Secreted protein n=1 Tax=Staurois parvus TaxID=386267 RepID=A0ABN9B862_9NEOB|nr:unnamed protein product [Staurois parvus]